MATTNRVWLLGGLALVTTLAVSWWELLFLPLGDSHEGRINGRFGLHLSNFLDDGLVGSGYLSSMAPFVDQPYAHHPPLLNVVQAGVGSVLGEGEWQLHLAGYVGGLVTVAALLWLCREMGFGSWPSLGGVALAMSMPMFWIYARLGLGVAPVLVFLALWVRTQRTPGESTARWLMVAAFAAAFASWTGAAVVLICSLLGLRDAGDRHRAKVIGVVGLCAVGITLAWALGVSTASELFGHVGRRVQAPVGFGEFVDQYRFFYGVLFPAWYRWLIPLALVMALAARRTRVVAGILLVVFGAWTVGLSEAAFVHDYWTYPLLIPVVLGWVVALEWTGTIDRAALFAAGATLAVIVLSFHSLQTGSMRNAYFNEPSRAGQLLRSLDPAVGQEVGWVAGAIEEPRWLSYYWRLPSERIDPGLLETIDDDDLVLVRIDRLPPWLTRLPDLVAQEGRYGLTTAAALRQFARPAGP